MIDLEQVKKRVDALEKNHHYAGHSAFNEVISKGVCSLCALLVLTHELIEEVELYKTLYKETREVYAFSVKTENELQREKAEFESKLCGVKELYELHQSNRPDLPFAVRAKIVFGIEEIFQQAFSSAPECKHEQELMKHIGEESALACEGGQAVAIFKDKQIAALQA